MVNLVRASLILCLSLPLVAVNAAAFEVNLGDRFLDYGNGAINLDHVTHISPSMQYKLTVASDEPESYFTAYGESNFSNLEALLSWFSPEQVAVLQQETFYFYEISATIMFDDFTLTIISDQRFFKIPVSLDGLDGNEVNRLGQFLRKSGSCGAEFDVDVVSTIETCISKMASNISLLDKASAAEIVAQLKRGNSIYNNAVQ